MRETQKETAGVVKSMGAVELNAFNRYLLLKYDIDADQYQMVYAKQNGLCAICHSSKSAKGKFAVALDAQGLKRGLICNRCNMATILFNHRADLMIKAAALLEPLNPSI